MTRKTNMKTWVAAAAVVAASFPAMALAAIHVKLAVDASSSPARLYVTSNDAQCPGGPSDCIQVPKGGSDNLFFDLDNACHADGPDYKLQQFRIAEAPKQWPSPGNPLPAHMAADFGADANSGVIDLSAGTNQLKDDRIKFKDDNSTAYEVFYEIVAVGCSGAGEARLDPSIKNTGR
jgi:hypothetical protein